MADRWYNVALGGQLPQDVTESGADNAAFAGVRITYDAVNNSKTEVVKALLAIKAYIEVNDTWPPV